MFLCVCVCLYIYIVYIYIYIYTVYMYIQYICVCVCLSVSLSLYLYMYTHTHIYISVCLYVCLQDTTIEGFSVPRGQVVMYVSHAVHRDPEVFQQPDHFLPDRWTGR